MKLSLIYSLVISSAVLIHIKYAIHKKTSSCVSELKDTVLELLPYVFILHAKWNNISIGKYRI